MFFPVTCFSKQFCFADLMPLTLSLHSKFTDFYLICASFCQFRADSATENEDSQDSIAEDISVTQTRYAATFFFVIPCSLSRDIISNYLSFSPSWLISIGSFVFCNQELGIFSIILGFLFLLRRHFFLVLPRTHYSLINHLIHNDLCFATSISF